MKKEKEHIFLASPHMSEEGYEKYYIEDAFEKNFIAPLGENVIEFERELGAKIGARTGAALSSGTAAIQMALMSLGVGAGDIVFAQSLTFSASVNPVIYVGARPVFIDSDYETWNMSPRALEAGLKKYAAMGQLPKAVIVVHLYGLMADMDEIMRICAQYGVPIIEDAAEALGTTYSGACTGNEKKYAGTFGDYGIFSFNGNKIITTSGGGMLVSADENLTKQATFLATQARDPARHYQHSQIGYNYRMSNVTAGIGRGQLLHLEEHKAAKKAIYQQYLEAFADIPEIAMNPMNPQGDANNWLSGMIIEKDCGVTPDMVMDALEKEINAESRPVWKPMHLQPVFAAYDFFAHNEDGSSVGEDIFDRGLCLPSDIKNTPEDMEQIIRTVRACFGR